MTQYKEYAKDGMQVKIWSPEEFTIYYKQKLFGVDSYPDSGMEFAGQFIRSLPSISVETVAPYLEIKEHQWSALNVLMVLDDEASISSLISFVEHIPES